MYVYVGVVVVGVVFFVYGVKVVVGWFGFYVLVYLGDVGGEVDVVVYWYVVIDI